MRSIVVCFRRLALRRRLLSLGGLSAVLVLGLLCYYGFWRYQLKRFQVLAPGVLIRSAQPTEFGLRHAVRKHGVRTVISLQLFDFRLHRSWYDLGRPQGTKESEFVRNLGARLVQWPMGEESCWPWPDAWELEEFFRLVDDPVNRPVLIHCMGGRHRTGTFAALYRMEYDRWTPERALAEMYSFSFGGAVPVQERNLRTYQPRPLPDEADWPAFAAAFDLPSSARPAEAVPLLAHRLRASPADGSLRRNFERFVRSDSSYALPFASRVVVSPSDPGLPDLLSRSRLVLESTSSAGPEIAAAAALIADFGLAEDRARLLEIIRRESAKSAPDEFYESLVRGVTNRYTRNRLAYLRPILDDRRPRLGSHEATNSYTLTAVARMMAITDALPDNLWTDDSFVAVALPAAVAWFEAHEEAAELVALVPPELRDSVDVGDGPQEEDLTRMRR